MSSIRTELGNARVDRLIGQALEDHAEEIWSDAMPTHAFIGRLRGRRADAAHRATTWRLVAVGLALIGLVTGLLFAAGRLGPADRLVVVERLVDAANRRDARALAPLFLSTGAILELPKVRWTIEAQEGGNVGRPEVYMSDEEVHDGFAASWLDVLDEWGFEGVLERCTVNVEVVCDVRTRWHVLQVEIGERWVIRFDDERISYLGMFRSNLRPPNPKLPLGVNDLADWADWVRTTSLNQNLAARFIGTEGVYLFPPHYFYFGMASPAEIGASIREYLEATR